MQNHIVDAINIAYSINFHIHSSFLNFCWKRKNLGFLCTWKFPYQWKIVLKISDVSLLCWHYSWKISLIKLRNILKKSVFELVQKYFLSRMNISKQIAESIEDVDTFRTEVEAIFIIKDPIEQVFYWGIVILSSFMHIWS